MSMMPLAADYPRFCSSVRLELRAEGRSFDLAAIGPNDIIPREPLDLPTCDADVVMDVDGQQFLWRVHLKNGAVPFDQIVKAESLGDVERLG
jgi:hypothetical protein